MPGRHLLTYMQMCEAIMIPLEGDQPTWTLMNADIVGNIANNAQHEAPKNAHTLTINALMSRWEAVLKCARLLHTSLECHQASEQLIEHSKRLLESRDRAEKMMYLLDDVGDCMLAGLLKESCNSVSNEIGKLYNKMEHDLRHPIMVIKTEPVEQIDVKPDIICLGRVHRSLEEQPAFPRRRAVEPLHYLKLSDADFFRQFSPKDKRSSKFFVQILMENEKIIFDKKSYCEKLADGLQFNVQNFKKPYLIRSTRGLGLEVPTDLKFETVCDYLGTEKERDPSVTVIDSLCQSPMEREMHLSEIVAEMKKPVNERQHFINVLSKEFSDTGCRLDKEFVLPTFVLKGSIEHIVLGKLRDEVAKLEAKLDDAATLPYMRKALKQEKNKLKRLIDGRPKYTKFFIISMAGSFTDVHVDFSGSSVYYHVILGCKIFYICPPTPENLKLYAKHELTATRTWIAQSLRDSWQRLEIRAGETALIPAGWLHFVFTPEDSIVIGGNFLMPDSIQIQFKMTKLEEEALVKRKMLTENNLYRGFHGLMFDYTKYIIIENLEKDHGRPSVEMDLFIKQGKEMLDNLQPNKKTDWLTCAQKQRILSDLKRVLKRVQQQQPTPCNQRGRPRRNARS